MNSCRHQQKPVTEHNEKNTGYIPDCRCFYGECTGAGGDTNALSGLRTTAQCPATGTGLMMTGVCWVSLVLPKATEKKPTISLKAILNIIHSWRGRLTGLISTSAYRASWTWRISKLNSMPIMTVATVNTAAHQVLRRQPHLAVFHKDKMT